MKLKLVFWPKNEATEHENIFMFFQLLKTKCVCVCVCVCTVNVYILL